MNARVLDAESNETEIAGQAWKGDGSSGDPSPEARTVILVSPDAALRQRLAESLTALRWRVREACGGAEAMMLLERAVPEAMLVDDWLPDLEVSEFSAHVRLLYPETDVLASDGEALGTVGRQGRGARSSRRGELLHAIRKAQEAGLDLAARGLVRAEDRLGTSGGGASARRPEAYRRGVDGSVIDGSLQGRESQRHGVRSERDERGEAQPGTDAGLPGLVGSSEGMQELARLIRMVAPQTTTVLIEGETGTGKEVVARALHRLSSRAEKPLVVLNCAAIPEALLEAELFGHARGAFTGAVQSRIGRIEASHGGTLLLDEIGEMPLGMQAKILRFLEQGEVQRVGDNQTMRIDVRVIAATHQPLERRSAEGTFRLDLYHRLAVFPLEVPPLRERREDIPALAEHFLGQARRDGPRKRLRADALAKLQEHAWPGNVRELMHVLERGAILSGKSAEIGAEDIRYRRTPRA